MGRTEKIKNACLYVKQGTVCDCMCMFLDCVRLLPFVKVKICGVNESYLKGAAPLQTIKCNTAYSFKLFLLPGGNCNVFSLNFKWRRDCYD